MSRIEPDRQFSLAPMTGAVHAAYRKLRNPLIIDAMGTRHGSIPVPWQPRKPKVFGNLPKDAVSVADALGYARTVTTG